MKNILKFSQVSKKDVALVGGKNASLGEMIRELTKKGMNIPDGFCLTADAYRYFLEENGIQEKLEKAFKNFSAKDIKKLKETGKMVRTMIERAHFPKSLEEEIKKEYREMSKMYKEKNVSVAVRSSATAEDLPTASFAGQHDTYLNVSGEEELLKHCKKCIASMFSDRAIAYREEKGFNHLDIALSVGVQKMVRSDLSSSGVMFTIDTETGFPNVILINSIYGIGEMIVQGKITPDEYFVFKPTLKKNFKPIVVRNLGRKNKKYIYGKTGGLKEVPVPNSKQLKFSITDEEALQLAKWGMQIEKHYGMPMDIEWAKDGKDGQLYIVQARPETVHSNDEGNYYEEYKVKVKADPIVTGIAVGNKIGIGKARVINNVANIGDFQKGEVLIANMTDPDWVPIMRLASAIVTNEGGKTAHAAIVSRELGVPAIVGTENATKVIKTGDLITIDCTEGLNGKVYKGKIDYTVKRYNLEKIPKVKTKIMANIGAPDTAFRSHNLPVSGVGLAREEFIIAEKIRVHPLALYHYNKLKDKKLKKKIDEITVEHKDKKDYFIKELAEGIGQIASAFYPKPVIVRFSDFKTNEYRELVGGHLYEPHEQNPMMGWRGASRYYDPEFKPAFKMECEAIKRVRDVFGLDNVEVMVPFCRTPEEGRKVRKIIEDAGLKKMKVYVMCETPSNVILIDEFLDVFDGMSIGSNDLTQLTLGLDRDNGRIQKIADERNEAILEQLKKIIRVCKKRKKYCGICGQGPSDFPEFAEFLMKNKIESISLNPDTVVKTLMKL